uniref:G-protein coupled receptors family 2 profile 1 domain-containing protein n=1 Tax=Nothoprocta perdicaria TaxID=30464 RepID=A0A8C7EE26_NOTPE
AAVAAAAPPKVFAGAAGRAGAAGAITDFLFESWKAYSEECQRNMSRLPAPTGEQLVCNRTFDKFSCWPDALPNSTVNVSCPWFLPWYHKGEGGMRVRACVCRGECTCTSG